MVWALGPENLRAAALVRNHGHFPAKNSLSLTPKLRSCFASLISLDIYILSFYFDFLQQPLIDYLCKCDLTPSCQHCCSATASTAPASTTGCLPSLQQPLASVPMVTMATPRKQHRTVRTMGEYSNQWMINSFVGINSQNINAYVRENLCSWKGANQTVWKLCSTFLVRREKGRKGEA